MVNNICRARLKAGLTQKQVASAVNKSQTTVAAWESGRAQPDAATIVKLSELFHVSSDYLLGISLIEHHENFKLSNEARIDDLREHDKVKLDSYIQKVLDFCIGEAKCELSPTFSLSLDCLLSQLTHIKNIVYMYRTAKEQTTFDDLMGNQELFKGLSAEDQAAIRALYDIASKAPIDTVFAQRALYEIACSSGSLSKLVMGLKEDLSKFKEEPYE